MLTSKLKALALVAGAFATFSAGSAQALTIDFEGISSDFSYVNYDNAGPSVGGFNFNVSHGHVIGKDYYSSYYATNNGSAWLVHDSSGNMSLDNGGGAFSLSQFDFGTFDPNSRPSSPVTVTGYLLGGGILTHSLTQSGNFSTILLAGWNNLTSVVFSGNGYGTYDNFIVNAGAVSAVPVPAALQLVLSAFGLMGFVGWKRRKQA